MSKSAITWIVVIVVIIIIALVWWYISAMTHPAATPATTESSAKSIVSFTLPGLTPPVNGTVDNTNYSDKIEFISKGSKEFKRLSLRIAHAVFPLIVFNSSLWISKSNLIKSINFHTLISETEHLIS